MGFEVNETSLMDVRQINQLLYVLEQVNIHNLIIGGQSSKKEDQLCDNIVYGTDIRYETRRESDGLGSITMKVPVRYNKTFSWKEVCKNRGGVMTYPLERKTIGECLHKKLINHFTVGKMADNYLNLYKNILNYNCRL